MAIEIKVRRGEHIDKAIRRLKKAVDSEGTLKDMKENRYFEKPSDKKRKKRARARTRARREARERDSGRM